MMLTPTQIAAACGAAPVIAETWCAPLNAAMTAFDISTPKRQASFLAQIGHESAGLSALTENLNYTPDALLAAFNTATATRFTRTDAYRYGRTSEHLADQHLIASILYASRMGNGPMETGDGWTYRARGPLGTTGKANYAAARDALRKLIGSDVPDFVAEPDQVATPKWGAMCAALFWHDHGCNELADRGDYDGISDVINIGHRTKPIGDANGYVDRVRRLVAANKALSVEA